MKYLLKGRLSAMVCDDSRAPLARASVRIYQAAEDEGTGFVTSPQAYSLVNTQASAAKQGRLLFEGELDKDGYFYAELPASYKGKLIEVDVCFEQQVGVAVQMNQMHLALFQPLWKRSADHLLAAWAQCLPKYLWCRAQGICRGDTLSGRVVDSHSGLALEGVRVVAFGLDWEQDQALGEAVTDAKGRFVIQSPNTIFSRLRKHGGRTEGTYDLYFRIQSQASRIPLYVEGLKWRETTEAEAADRCLYVDIRVETNLARLQEASRVTQFQALTASKSILGLRSGNRAG